MYVVGEAQNAFHTEQDDHENEENCRFVAEELEHLLAMNKAPSSKCQLTSSRAPKMYPRRKKNMVRANILEVMDVSMNTGVLQDGGSSWVVGS